MRSRRSIIVSSTIQHEPPWYGTVCPVVWEDGGSNPASYLIERHPHRYDRTVTERLPPGADKRPGICFDV